MKVLITSDSHGLTDELLMLVKRHGHETDALIHCGDSELPADAEEMKPFFAVNGNCDFSGGYPNDFVKEIGPVTFLVTHGHLYNVKMTVMNLMYKAEEVGANIVCFGHSHIAGSFKEDNRIFINPGSLRLPRNSVEKTYVICEIAGQKVAVIYYNDKGKRVDALCKSYNLEIKKS
ncbi:hypothetical protein EV207_101123 [Scopulibacillus darangshiensis]|uniref:Phosphoesterase n=1 Tax=Scopulibacillus darangshiensis TaxID=442528 RepID=A0A4R2PB00_9BACL|nr:metallophosphoesterase [Scopulibacillus darangshiensis]TCP32147.1 hypothetical protein EV207_101123 [Scopulibacillus darangshiensis]